MSEQNQQFDSHNQWITYAPRWLTAHPKYGEFFRAICIDSAGRICYSGKQFQEAHDEETFPIRWWWPDQPIEELNKENIL